MEEYRIQPPRLGHIPQLAQLCRETFAEAYKVTLPPDELQVYLDDTFAETRLAEEISNSSMLYRIVLDEDERVRAYIKFQLGQAPDCVAMKNGVELQRFYVALGMVGRGLGGRLLAQGEQLVFERGHDGIWLKVWDGNRQAQRMYAKRGYDVRGEVMYPVGRIERRVLVMARGFG